MKSVPGPPRQPHDDYALFQQQVEADMREEALSKWIDKRIGETFVRVDGPYRDCAMDMPWLTESINASGTLRRTKNPAPDGWIRPQAHPCNSSDHERLPGRRTWLSSGNNLKLLNRGEFFRRQIRA